MGTSTFSATTLRARPASQLTSGEERPGEVGGVERAQVLDPLPDPDQLHRDPELVGDRQGDPALGGAVELRQHDPGHVDRLGEQARLLQPVLAGRRVDREQHLVRRARDAAGDDAVDLAQLVHQMALGVQPPGGVDDDDVAAAGLGGGDGVERDRGGIAAGLRRDEVGPGPLRPRLELLAGRGPERVGGADHARAAGLAQVPGDLADRGRLAGAVHAAHEQDGGMGGDVDAGIARRCHQLGDDLLEPR